MISVLKQHAELDLYNYRSLKQHPQAGCSSRTHYIDSGHTHPLHNCCVLRGEAENASFIVNCLTRPDIEPSIFCTSYGTHDIHLYYSQLT